LAKLRSSAGLEARRAGRYGTRISGPPSSMACAYPFSMQLWDDPQAAPGCIALYARSMSAEKR